jgi:hypothetical protein
MAESKRNPIWNRLYMRYSEGIRPAAITLAIFGVLILVAWYLTNDYSTMSMLLMLSGISVIVLSFMLYFLTPVKYLRSDVVDAMALSNTLNLSKMLSSLLIESKGIYVPASSTGMMKIFIPISTNKDVSIGSLKPGNETFSVSSGGIKGISLTPPGYGLYRYAQSIGAAFTPEGIENEIKDILENGLELASSVNVRHIVVTMRGVVDREMCASIRRENPRICEQVGCPVCSLVGCMVVGGTGRKVRIENVKADDNTVTVSYGLIRE